MAGRRHVEMMYLQLSKWDQTFYMISQPPYSLKSYIFNVSFCTKDSNPVPIVEAGNRPPNPTF